MFIFPALLCPSTPPMFSCTLIHSQHASGSPRCNCSAYQHSTLCRPLPCSIRQSQGTRCASDLVSHYCSVRLISFLLAAEAQEKKAQKAAAEERARACKDKQIMAKAKAAESERRQNQENIHRKLYLTPMSPLLNQLPLALDTRHWGEHDFCQPTPQDTTVISHHISFFHACSLLLRCSSACVTYLQESNRLPSVSLPAPARFLLHVLARPLNPWHMMETCRQR